MPKAKRTKDGRWKKLTYEEVKKCFEDTGCILLSKEYVNARTHLEHKCTCGNRARIVFYSFKIDNRCKKCGSFKNRGHNKLTYEHVKCYIESLGLELLQNEYIGAHSQMKIKCKCGEVFYHSWNALQQGRRQCPVCVVKSCSGENNYQWKKDRRQHQEDCKFRHRAHQMLKDVLKRMGQKKVTHSAHMLG